MHPDCRGPSPTRKPLWNATKPLSQPGAIFSVPHHLQQPIGKRDQRKQSKERAVEQIHAGGVILNGNDAFLITCRVELASYNSSMRNLWSRSHVAPSIVGVAAVVLMSCVFAFAAKEFVMP